MTQQLDLLPSGAPRFHRARREDPASSHDAAAAIERSGTAAAHYRIALDFLHRYPGSTCAELSKVCGIEYHALGKRLSELVRDKVARRVDRTPATVLCTVLGKRVCRWWPYP